MKFFNTAGPVNPAKHYTLDPFARLVDNDLLSLVAQEKYFVLHAPRQTGKTSALLGLLSELNASGDYCCVYMNVEVAQGLREDIGAAFATILDQLARRIDFHLPDLAESMAMSAAVRELAAERAPGGALGEALARLSELAPRPLVLFIDEIDSLVGDTLITVLRQIRAGYDMRPASFPQSIVLCGVRDIKDYRIHASSQKEVITGGSCFNIKAESLRLGDFSEPELRALYAQHTAATGQPFEEQALAAAWSYTAGQPWLANALAYEACFKPRGVRARAQPITAEVMAGAKERLVVSRATHLDQLTDKLGEPRVQRVVEPIVRGLERTLGSSNHDISYVEDLGLIKRGPEGVRIANAIYREVIPRELTDTVQFNLEANYQQSWYVTPDHRLDLPELLGAFQQFFREHSESWSELLTYKEAGPQLLLQAFLQRIVNGGGRIDREYGLGRMRTDLLVQWPLDPEQGFLGPVQRVVIELKLLHKSLRTTIAQGLRQTHDYVQRTGAADAHLLVFDRRTDVAWDKKVFRLAEQHDGLTITVWGM